MPARDNLVRCGSPCATFVPGQRKMEVTIRKLPALERSETIERQSTTAPRDEIAYLGFSGGAQALVEAYRAHGYCQASINPLDTRPFDASLIAELDPGVYGLAFDKS